VPGQVRVVSIRSGLTAKWR